MRPMLPLSLLVCLLAHPTRLLANAWMLGTNEWSVETYNKFYWATEDYDHHGDRVEKANDGKYEEYRSELKVEFGFRDQLNLLFSVPYKWGKWEDINGALHNDGVEFVGVGAKLRLSEESEIDPAASLQVKYEVPGGYDKDEPPSLGHEKSDLELSLIHI